MLVGVCKVFVFFHAAPSGAMGHLRGFLFLMVRDVFKHAGGRLPACWALCELCWSPAASQPFP